MKSTLLLTLVGLLLSHSASAQNTRVYFGTSQSKGIYFSDLDPETGRLSKPTLAIALERPGFITIHPNKHIIYAASIHTGKDGVVVALKINDNGSLSLLNTQSTHGRNPCHVSLDATGQCLMVANYGSGSVASFQIQQDGSLSPARSIHQHKGSAAHPKRQTAPRAHSIFPNPANTHAYVPDLGIDKVMIYQLDPKAGTLTASGHAPIPGTAMGPRHMKWTADGKYAYVLNELDLSISIFKPGPTDGALEFIQTISTLPAEADKNKMSCAEIRIHPNGKFIYASNRDLSEKGRDSITLFTRFEEDLQRKETVPAQVWIPRNFNIDPSGRWMLVGGQKSHDISIFKIDPETGRLEFTGTKVPFEGGPICIEFL